MSMEGHTNIKLYSYKLITFLQELITSEKLDCTKAELYEKVQLALDEFVDRMVQNGENQFHGGDGPDLADFRAYSVLQRVQHTFIVMKIMEDREDRTLINWYAAMKRLCDPQKAGARF